MPMWIGLAELFTAVSILAGDVVVPVPVSWPTTEAVKITEYGVTCSGGYTACTTAFDVLVKKRQAPGT